jgi:D-alanine-D-alanine ligase
MPGEASRDVYAGGQMQSSTTPYTEGDWCETMAEKTVAVLFGGRSVEHEVSVITGHQIMDALKAAGYRVLPIYLTKDGEWYAGEGLHNLKLYTDPAGEPTSAAGVFRVSLSPDRSVRQLIVHPSSRPGLFRKPPRVWADVFFPCLHGSFGEDGALQGLFELADVPYVGAGVAASAIAMDKALTKMICRDAGIPVLDWLILARAEWGKDAGGMLDRIEQFCAYPVIVKPVCLGSSIGVKRCNDRAALREAVAAGLVLDDRMLIEQALTDFIEINCAVMGPPEQASVCEQPVTHEAILSFDAKYKRGGKGAKQPNKPGGMASLDRIIPAPISAELTQRVQNLALQTFRAVGAAGTSRIDFMYQPHREALLLCEINSIPGSLAFYLWEATGIPFDELVDRLVTIALQRHEERSRTQFSFEVNLLRKKDEPVSEITRSKP